MSQFSADTVRKQWIRNGDESAAVRPEKVSGLIAQQRTDTEDEERFATTKEHRIFIRKGKSQDISSPVVAADSSGKLGR